MRLTKLVLQGFKSFADKTSFEFPDQLTAVVGPNGSGKSNVADAIRWVLGEQSTKLLRTKQQSDLIFSGSAKLSSLGMAQVELYLDNSDGKFPLEYPEVVLNRKLFRSGESEYRINGAKVRLSDVVMLLARANFGQKSYAVIGQGMITQFLNATPQERKLFFDEATGVREFQIKRDTAINKLIRTEDNVQQSETLLSEIEPHLRSLDRLVKRLEKREKLEEQLHAVQVQYFGSVWHDLDQRNHAAESTLAEHTATVEQLTTTIAGFQAKTDGMAAEQSRTERYEQLQRTINQLQENKSRSVKDQAVLKGKLEVEHQRQGNLSLVWLQRKESDIAADIERLQSEQRGYNETIQQKEVAATRAATQLRVSQADIAAEQTALNELQAALLSGQHTMTIPEVRDSLHALFSEQEDFLHQLLDTTSLDEFTKRQQHAKRITKHLAELLDQLSQDGSSELDELRQQLGQRKQRLIELTSDRERIQAEANSAAVHQATAESQRDIVGRNLARLQAELQTVRTDIAAANSIDSGSDDFRVEYETGIKQFDTAIAALDTQIAAERVEMDSFNQAEETKKNKLLEWQNSLRTLQRQLQAAQQAANTSTVELARIDTRRQDIRHEIEREVVSQFHNDIFRFRGNGQANTAELERDMMRLHKQLAAIGDVDNATVAEHADTKQRYDFLHGQLSDLRQSISDLETVIEQLDTTIRIQFKKNFAVINRDFEKYFQVLFGGGRSRLELLTETDVEPAADDGDVATTPASLGKRKKKQKLISGIDILAHPPGKKVMHTAALSGGEKSLVSIALLCSIIANNPSPFVVLDEVEAALDEENSEKLSAILTELAKKTQIIIITHNRVTMQSADSLYGVTTSNSGKSHILSVSLADAKQLTSQESS